MAHIQTLVHRCGPRTRILELGCIQTLSEVKFCLCCRLYVSVASIFSGFTRLPVHMCSPKKVYTILARLHFGRWRGQGWRPSTAKICLNWNFMLIKLGLSGLNHRWIESFPVNCEQICKVLAWLHLFTLLFKP